MRRKKEHPLPIMLGNTIVDTFKNIHRRNLMSFTSVVSIVATLLVLGIFIIISINIANVGRNMQESLKLKVFLNNELTEQDIIDLEDQFNLNPAITGYTYESNDEALQKYAERLEDYSGLLEGFSQGNNPVSNSYTVQVSSPNELEEVKQTLEESDLNAVNYVKYGDNYYDAIMMFSEISIIVCLVILVILSIVSIVIIYNTIKLTCYSNRKEIEIMQFIGAEGWYIKLPFFFEGLLLGGLAAVCATLIIAIMYTYLLGLSNTLAYLPLDTKLVSPGYVIYPIMIFSLIYGVLIGSFGSLFSIRKYFYN